MVHNVKHNIEAKIRMSNNRKGKGAGNQNALGHKHTKEWKQNKKQKNLGENNPNWKGGMDRYPHEHTKTSDYRNWRTSVFERDNYTCQECGIKCVMLHPHHILSYTHCPEFRFDIDNGLTVCVPCHRKIHRGGQ